ncbi:short-chain fatty acid transporter [Mailhella massiliensis]|uniref:short-chain fatty acid transporter n=1 Tax=Mailhella massiliensis TaxID=1903261 RepID=UPI00097D94AA|nr:TIGR00366 family protein [Mailhella massiliensis]
MLYGLSRFFTMLVKRFLPDAYILVILLTLVSFITAFIFTESSCIDLINAWGKGFSSLLMFTIQSALIYTTGHALASTHAVRRLLDSVAGIPRTPFQAALMTFYVTAFGSLFNWGFGLVVGGLIAREMARRVPNIDYGFTVAAGYSGFVVWHGGFSSAVAADLATSGGVLSKALAARGLPDMVIPFSDSILSASNITITAVMLIVLPFMLKAIHPHPDEVVPVDPALFGEEKDLAVPPLEDSPASRLEHSRALSLLFSALGFAYLGYHFWTRGMDINLNILIIIFMWLGIFLHGTPIRYVVALKEAVAGASGIITQFPLYGGIQGIMVASGLASMIASGVMSIATAKTLPLLTFISAGIINIFIPSGGGQWIVQAPISIPPAIDMGANVGLTGMAVAYGDQWTNMIQPFWALPMLAIAGLGIRDIMGPCVMTLIFSGIIMGAGLYFFA